ncbi:hypothetical protein J6590_005688 [Homalodisca vitripennis]|nr:hypothetical protein J6590_005688 [Homalodisca vitripennis]
MRNKSNVISRISIMIVVVVTQVKVSREKKKQDFFNSSVQIVQARRTSENLHQEYECEDQHQDTDLDDTKYLELYRLSPSIPFHKILSHRPVAYEDGRNKACKGISLSFQ